jgi:hypothetical protein
MGQRHAPAALYPRERPGTHCTGRWVCPRAVLDRCGKSRPHRDSIPRQSSPVAKSLYQLSYRAQQNFNLYVRFYIPNYFRVHPISNMRSHLAQYALMKSLVIRARSQGSACTATIRLIVQPCFLEVPTRAARCLHVLRNARDPSSERWNFSGREKVAENFA